MKTTSMALVMLALLTTLVYFLMGAGVLQASDLQTDEALPVIASFAGACCLSGGLLILARSRLLWVIGAVINALVILMFVSAYAARLGVHLCLPGVGTKVRRFSSGSD